MAKHYYSGNSKMSHKQKGGMISSDHGAMANLPQKEKMQQYPMPYYADLQGYRDNRDGIDAYASENAKKMNKQLRSPRDAS